ncbi:MAG: hypothetical protein AAF211_23255, partial [Myxococcota bacterium]
PPPSADLVDCPAGVCVSGTGSNGGTLYTYTVPPSDHPTSGLYEGACFDSTPGNELVVQIDVTGFSQIAATTCNTASGETDSAIVVLDGPADIGLPVELGCNEDRGPGDFCAQVDPTALPAGVNTVWVVIDEWELATFWDSTFDKTIDIELIP